MPKETKYTFKIVGLITLLTLTAVLASQYTELKLKTTYAYNLKMIESGCTELR